VTDAELLQALHERALLEGDFVLRSGRRSKYYLDKYRFSTQPDLLEELGKRIAAAVAVADPTAVRLAAPELGAVPLAAAAALASGLPFIIVRGVAKEYGTANRIEGAFQPGESVCLVEDVVTSGGAAVEAVEALREADLRCSTAVCVVDREEGGVDALARRAVRLRPLFTARDVLGNGKVPANRMVEPKRRGW
jgi:orotate phosphoribosyltransferase